MKYSYEMRRLYKIRLCVQYESYNSFINSLVISRPAVIIKVIRDEHIMLKCCFSYDNERKRQWVRCCCGLILRINKEATIAY